MKGELTGILKNQFMAAQEEYHMFYFLRNHPSPGIEYEDREKLSEAQRAAWVVRLNDQTHEMQIHLGQLVASAELLGETESLNAFRPFHEMKAYFDEDVHDMKQQLGKFGFTP